MPVPTFRFAPSPTGRLHLGHALSALLNADMAKRTGGHLLLRIEDTDLTRARPEHEAAICADLAWLGLVWEKPVRRQSEHFPAYRAALERLCAMGLVYPANETRTELAAAVARQERISGKPWPRDPDGAPLYPIETRADPMMTLHAFPSGPGAPALRLDMRAALARLGAVPVFREIDETLTDKASTALDPLAWGDPVIARKGTPTSYHLAVVVDDALQGVTHVVRGADIRPATALHRVLQALLDLPAPLYHHHRLIMGADGRKLSKSDDAAALRTLIDAGETPAGIRRRVGL